MSEEKEDLEKIQDWINLQVDTLESLKKKSSRMVQFDPVSDIVALKTTINEKAKRLMEEGKDDCVECCKTCLKNLDTKIKNTNKKRWEQLKQVEGKKYDNVLKHKRS